MKSTEFRFGEVSRNILSIEIYPIMTAGLTKIPSCTEVKVPGYIIFYTN